MPQYKVIKGTIYHGGKYIRQGGTVEMTEEEAARTTKVRRVTVLLEETNPVTEPVQPTVPPESVPEPEAEQAPSEPAAEPEPEQAPEQEPEAEPEQTNTEAEAPEPEQVTTNKKGKK